MDAQIATLSGLLTALAALGAPAVGVLAVLLKRADRVKQREIAEIRHEVTANSGASMRDAVDRIEAAVGDLAARIEVLEAERSRRSWWRV